MANERPRSTWSASGSRSSICQLWTNCRVVLELHDLDLLPALDHVLEGRPVGCRQLRGGVLANPLEELLEAGPAAVAAFGQVEPAKIGPLLVGVHQVADIAQDEHVVQLVLLRLPGRQQLHRRLDHGGRFQIDQQRGQFAVDQLALIGKERSKAPATDRLRRCAGSGLPRRMNARP